MAPSQKRQRTLFEFGPLVARKDRVSKVKQISEDEENDSDPRNIKFEYSSSHSHSRSSPASGRSIKANAPCQGQNTTSFVISLDSDTDGEAHVSSPQGFRTNKRSKKTTIVSSGSESSPSEARHKKRRRIVRGKRPSSSPPNTENNENADIAEEVDEDLILEERFRRRAGRSKYVVNLERLKRRRKGQKSESDISEESGNDSDVGNTGEIAYSDLGYIPGARPTELLLSDEDEEQREDKFIVEDDDEDGVLPELPAEFSMKTYQDLSNHFKVICQLFVHLATKKAKERRLFIKEATQKTYFSIPLTVIRRKLNGMKDSLVASSLWRADLKNALGKYPDFRLEHLDFSIPRCDACHLGGRISTLRGILFGREYDKETYEPSTNDKDEEVINWDLGRFCAARVQVYHMFTHWEYILYHNLRIEIEAFSNLLTCGNQHSTNRIFLPASRSLPFPEDLDDPDSIMEWLDDRGIINSEWHRIKEMMERAHKLEAKGNNEEDFDIS